MCIFSIVMCLLLCLHHEDFSIYSFVSMIRFSGPAMVFRGLKDRLCYISRSNFSISNEIFHVYFYLQIRRHLFLFFYLMVMKWVTKVCCY